MAAASPKDHNRGQCSSHVWPLLSDNGFGANAGAPRSKATSPKIPLEAVVAYDKKPAKRCRTVFIDSEDDTAAGTDLGATLNASDQKRLEVCCCCLLFGTTLSDPSDQDRVVVEQLPAYTDSIHSVHGGDRAIRSATDTNRTSAYGPPPHASTHAPPPSITYTACYKRSFMA